MHDLEALAQYVQQGVFCAWGERFTVPLWDGGELIVYAPEARATVYAGLRRCRRLMQSETAMNTTEAAELAAELRKAAQDLLLCVNAIMGQEQSGRLIC